MIQVPVQTTTPASEQFVALMNNESECIAALSEAFDRAVAQFGAARLAQCLREAVTTE